MREIINCLWFDGRGQEAAQFYTSVFPDSRITGSTPGGPDGGPLTVEFELSGRRFVALNGGPQFTFNEAVSFQIPCEDQAEVDRFWDSLTDGGEESQCGWLKDRFGVSWQVVPVRLMELLADDDPDVVSRVTGAFLPMRKLDIAAIEKAAAG